MSMNIRHVAPLPLLVLAACAQSDPGVGPIDSAMTPGTGIDAASDLATAPQGPPTLETGVDRAALAEAVTPQVIQFIRATQPGLPADTIQLGRPWGQFEAHKGPRLEFTGGWWMLAFMSGKAFTWVEAVRDGDSYKMAGIGLNPVESLAPAIELEQIPAISAALDRGRAGSLRRVGDGGYGFLAYELDAAPDAGRAEIMVQPYALMIGLFKGVDAGEGGVPEMTLDEFDALLPDE